MEKKESKFRLLTADEIECRVGQGGNNNASWCSVLLYKDARCDMKRLDEVFGTNGWQREHTIVGNCVVCTISIWDEENNQWVRKMDVGTAAKTEPEKSIFSDSFKRAATNVGIGRELYTSPKIFIRLNPDYDYKNNRLKSTFRVAMIGYSKDRKINKLVIVDQNNNPRYFYGITNDEYNEWLSKQKNVTEISPQPDDTPQQQQNPTTGDSALDAKLSQAITQIKNATTVKQLVTIWSEFPDLQGQHEFTSRMSARRADIENQKKSA